MAMRHPNFGPILTDSDSFFPQGFAIYEKQIYSSFLLRSCSKWPPFWSTHNLFAIHVRLKQTKPKISLRINWTTFDTKNGQKCKNWPKTIVAKPFGKNKSELGKIGPNLVCLITISKTALSIQHPVEPSNFNWGPSGEYV